jgi:hypothetical protein
MMSYADTLSKTSCGGFSIGKPNNVSWNSSFKGYIDQRQLNDKTDTYSHNKIPFQIMNPSSGKMDLDGYIKPERKTSKSKTKR